MSAIQSIRFESRIYSPQMAMNFLEEHGLKPLNRVIEGDYLTYRIRSPDKFTKFTTKKVKDNSSIILTVGFKK